jgi:hypothetical protein
MLGETKWDKFYNNQNATTKAWLDQRTKEYNQMAVAVGLPLFLTGMLLGFLIGVGF